MKLSQTLDRNELSREVLESIEPLTRANINELIEKYCTQLEKNGKRLDKGDKVRLAQLIRSDKLKIGMCISSSITSKLLEDNDIFPVLIN
ncbi:MAG: hypothetical protein PHG06_00225 [Parabacteroides sp.]|nr:hypothetical protein [Parabacteroides sp.]